MDIKERVNISRIEYIDECIMDYMLIDGWVDLLSFYREKKKFKLKKSKNLTYRLVNHWTKIGLIEDTRTSDKEWREYTFLEIVFINIIIALRSFNYPNEKILKVKEALFDISLSKGSCKEDLYLKISTEGKIPIMELYLSIIMLVDKPKNVYILVYNDGFADIATDDEITNSEQKGILNEDYIKISLNRILLSIFKNSEERLKSYYDLRVPVSSEELEVINSIRRGEYESIKIKLRNRKIIHFEGTEEIKDRKRIVDILHDNDFQDIEIKQEDGKISSLRRTIKKKFKATR